MTAALKQQKNRNKVLNMKMRGFEMAQSPEAYSEPCQTSKMDIFKKQCTDEKKLHLRCTTGL